MERKQALAAAAFGTVAFGAAVVAAAALGGFSFLGFGGHAPRIRATAQPAVAQHIRPKVITKYKDVYVKRVVNTTVAPAQVAPPVQLVASMPSTAPPTTLATPTPAAAVTPAPDAPAPPTSDGVSNDPPPTTTTIPSAPPTTGPGCPRIEYEDNGTWHCDD
jgi:hypothetical protein